jgi:ubiquinone/menaquinone biosynthesis C-methylase UbiE
LQKIVLNVGAGSLPLEKQTLFFRDYKEIRVDVLKEERTNIVSDVCGLKEIPDNFADAVWCVHVIEHVHWHDLPVALNSIVRVLKNDGFAAIRVPDLGSIADLIKEDLLTPIYETTAFPVSPIDIIYGHRGYFGADKNYNYAMTHKTGFTEKSMQTVLKSLGINAFTQCRNYEIMALIYKDVVPDLSKLNF